MEYFYGLLYTATCILSIDYMNLYDSNVSCSWKEQPWILRFIIFVFAPVILLWKLYGRRVDFT